MSEEGSRDIRSWVDQQVEEYKEVARVYAALYKGLLDNGVPEPAAVSMTCAYIRAVHGKPAEGEK